MRKRLPADNEWNKKNIKHLNIIYINIHVKFILKKNFICITRLAEQERMIITKFLKEEEMALFVLLSKAEREEQEQDDDDEDTSFEQ